MKLPFKQHLRQEYYSLLDQVFDSNMWSDGKMMRQFETDFSRMVKCESRAVSSGGAGLLACFQFLELDGGEVIVPTNTFWATTRAIQMAGGVPIFADISKDDLCLSVSELKNLITNKTKAVVVVHIGGHIAFQIHEIVAICKENNIPLIEDCAHAHGATIENKAAGTFGFAGAYSFYATKSLPTGDGGMVVSENNEFIKWVEKWRNYGKKIKDGVVTYPIQNGFNFRMNEFTAALGVIQVKYFPEIMEWKKALALKFDQIFERRVKLPDNVISGFYKYIVWDYPELNYKTGQVFGIIDLNHNIAKSSRNLTTAEWVACHHQCPPIWYGWEHAEKSVDEIASILLTGSKNILPRQE